MAEMLATNPAPERLTAGRPDHLRREPPVTLAFASDLHLVADVVAAALTSRGFEVRVLAWPDPPRIEPVQRQLAASAADVGILLYDVDMSIRMAEASALIRSWSGPWLVLTGASPGPAWGGLRIAGAAAVRASVIALSEVDELVRRLAAGEPDPAAAELAEHVESWRAVQARHGELQTRIDSLAPRELQVLKLLYRGMRVASIADQLGLSETTVRTQVRAILRKLDVRSQLAAVALLHAIDRWG
jgi:DNA-binding NarL/FixJ family response regulator